MAANQFGIDLPGLYRDQNALMAGRQQQQMNALALQKGQMELDQAPQLNALALQNANLGVQQKKTQIAGEQQSQDFAKHANDVDVTTRALGASDAVPDEQLPGWTEGVRDNLKSQNIPTMAFDQALAQSGGDPAKLRPALKAALLQGQTYQQQLAQKNADRTFDAGRTDASATDVARKTTAAETARHNKADEEIARKKAEDAASVGEFGRGMQGRAYNILARGLTDPTALSSPEYATAWQILSNPHVDPNTGTIVVPDLSAFKPPVGQGAAPGAPPAQRMPSIQGFAPPNPRQPEAASAGYANRLGEAANLIDAHQDAGTSLVKRAASALPGGNYIVGGDYQQLDQAERNFVNAQLRRESGAAISESEFQNARKQYFPQPGDGPAVLKQKKAARDMAVRNMALSAGNTLLPPGVIQQASPPKGAPTVPQNQGFGTTGSGGWKVERVQ